MKQAFNTVELLVLQRSWLRLLLAQTAVEVMCLCLFVSLCACVCVETPTVLEHPLPFSWRKPKISDPTCDNIFSTVQPPHAPTQIHLRALSLALYFYDAPLSRLRLDEPSACLVDWHLRSHSLLPGAADAIWVGTSGLLYIEPVKRRQWEAHETVAKRVTV